MSQKKVVGRSIAITLGIVCIILIAGLGGAMAYYTMTINDKNNKINSINAQLGAITGNNTNINATEIISQLNATINQQNATINQLNANIMNLNNENNQLQTWLASNITAYNSLQSTHNNYVNDHNHTNTEFQNLQTQITTLQNQISSLNLQVTILQNHLNDLNATYNGYVDNHHYTDSEYNSLTVASLTTVGLSVSNFNHYWPWDAASHLTINGYIFNMGTDTAYNCKFHVKVWSSTDTLLLDTTVDLGSISGRNYVYKSTETPYTGSGSYWSVIPEWTS